MDAGFYTYDKAKRQWRKLSMKNQLPRVMVADHQGNEFVIELGMRHEYGIGVQLREGYINVRPHSANFIQVLKEGS